MDLKKQEMDSMDIDIDWTWACQESEVTSTVRRMSEGTIHCSTVSAWTHTETYGLRRKPGPRRSPEAEGQVDSSPRQGTGRNLNDGERHRLHVPSKSDHLDRCGCRFPAVRPKMRSLLVLTLAMGQ